MGEGIITIAIIALTQNDVIDIFAYWKSKFLYISVGGGSLIGMKKYLSGLIKRKDLIFYLVISGLKAQHRNSVLGYLWWVLDPLLNVLIYYCIVVFVFKKAGGPDYGIYLVVGMIVWRWLGSTITSTSRSIVAQMGLISQINLPKVIFPICAVLTQFINFGFGLFVIGFCCILFNVVPGLAILWLPVIAFSQLCFMMAIVLPVAYVYVFIRDVDNIINHLLRIWFFGSPVIWYPEMIPAKGRWLLEINPMTHFLEGYRDIFIHNTNPNYMKFLYIGMFSILILSCVMYYYKKNEYKIIKAL